MKKLLNAIRFMTIIPLPWPEHAELSEAGRSSAMFPVVGLIIGLILAGASRLAALVWPAPVVAAAAVVLWIVLTAGLHLDGLADLADGLGGGWDVESRLRIMKDSSIGTYGALALVSLILLKAAILYAIGAGPEGPQMLFRALVFVPAAGRCAQVLSIRIFPPAKKEGFGASFKSGVKRRDAAAAVIITAVVGVLTLGVTGVAALAAAVLFMLACGKWISVRLGGLNGDSYGAVCELSELFTLVFISIIARVA